MPFWVLLALSVSAVVYCDEMDLDELSTLLHSGIDYNLDPCDNFNDYVCGKWLEKNPSVEYMTSWDMADMTKVKTFQIIKDILERDNIVDENSQLYYEKKYYEACMDASLKQGRELYSKIFSKSNDFESWQDVAKYYAKKIGETFLFQIVLDDSKDLNLVRPYKSRTNTHPFEFFDIDQVYGFLEYRYKISKKRNNESGEPLLEFMRNINELVFDLEFDTDIYTIEQFKNFSDSNCTLSRNSNAAINWIELLQVLADENKNFLHPSFKIAIDTNYFSELCKILSSTSSSTVVQYMQFSFEYSYDVFNCLHKGFSPKTSAENNELSSRSYHCINRLPMTHGISNEIINTEEFAKRKKYVETLIASFKPILFEEINNSWIDDIEKKDALDLIEKIQLNVVELNYDDDKHFSEDKSISYKFKISDVPFKYLINFKKAQTVHKFKVALVCQNLSGDSKGQDCTKRSGKRNKSQRTKREIKMIGQYEEDGNVIQLTPSYLNAPYFHRKAPEAYNLARMGRLIGHEMSHSFDISHLSNNYETDWESENPDLANIFNDKKACLVKQFDDLASIFKLETSATDTLNENYADLAGLKAAFKVMRQRIGDNPSLGMRTPQFNKFNADKLFFISFANHFCEKPGVNDDVDHAPYALRIIGTLQNMKEFSKAFQCRKDHFMNPKNKCDFWKNENP